MEDIILEMEANLEWKRAEELERNEKEMQLVGDVEEARRSIVSFERA